MTRTQLAIIVLEEEDLKYVLWISAGLAASLTVVCLIGFLDIQKTGLRGGAVFGLDNQLVGVTEPNSGYLQALAMAAVAGAILLVLTARSAQASTRGGLAFSVGFGLGVLALVVVGFVLASRDFMVANVNAARPPWVEGWITAGGTNPIVSVLLLVAAYQVIRVLRSGSVTAVGSERSAVAEHDRVEHG